MKKTDVRLIAPKTVGLRAYDTTIGFRNVDERNAILTDFGPTHTIGMAAVLAGAIKGRDIIRDAHKLKKIAAEVLKINPFAFDTVVSQLAELEMVRDIRKTGGEIVSFTENIPLLYDNVHEQLGELWSDLHPSELERQFLVTLEKLASSPVIDQQLLMDIGGDQKVVEKLRTIGESAELIRYYPLRDGTKVVTSPLHAFEHPDRIALLFEHHPAERIQEAFQSIRAKPGFPILMNDTQPLIEEIVRLGLIPAPTVVGADHQQRAFAIFLYGLDPTYMTTKKTILDRALALIACVRCGEVSGGVTKIRMPDRLLAALTDPNRNYTLRGHSSTTRQYEPLIRMGVIEPVHLYEDRWGARLQPTSDNLEAVQLARLLLQRGSSGMLERGNEQEAAQLLFTEGEYLAPIETIALARRKMPAITGDEINNLWEEAIRGGL